MTEAERYLEASLHEKESEAVSSEASQSESAPSSSSKSGHPQKSFPEDIPANTIPAVAKDIGVGWLDFVNYFLLPINGICLVGAVIFLFSQEALQSAVGLGSLFLYALDFGMIVALFIGLRKRESWAWWLLMIFLVLKAPLGALARFSPTSEADPFWGFMLGGFLIICLPQLIYFYKRRGLFHVQFENDR